MLRELHGHTQKLMLNLQGYICSGSIEKKDYNFILQIISCESKDIVQCHMRGPHSRRDYGLNA